MVEKITTRFHPPQRGEVVIAEQPGDRIALIKRVIALPGEILEVRGGHAMINNQTIDEPWVVNFCGPDYPATIIPPEHVFILGDNRSNSHDSRAIGPVPYEQIVGIVRFVYWPPERMMWAP